MQKGKKGKLRVVFFGLGSIGKKHANIIQNNYDYEIFAFRTNKGQEISNLKIQEFESLEDTFSARPDIAFITNPTFLHTEMALECAKRNIDLFIEKPISHSLQKIEELEQEIKKRKLFTYVGYNMRFHPVLIYLNEIISRKEKPIYFRASCSSYLPNWRPGQDYSKSYSAKKKLGGGVILDLSHEFDYITWFFGDIREINGYSEKISNLNIESEDLLEAEITCDESIKGNLHLDCISHKQERKIKIYYNDEYIEGDLLTNIVKIVNKHRKEKTIHLRCDKDDTYKRQIKYFFNQYFKKNYHLTNNFSEALKTFKKIMEFRKKCYGSWEGKC